MHETKALIDSDSCDNMANRLLTEQILIPDSRLLQLLAISCSGLYLVFNIQTLFAS